MINNRNKAISIIGLLIAILLTLLFSPILSSLVELGETYLSGDHNIDARGVFLLKLILVLTISSIILISIFVYFNLHVKLQIISNQLIHWSSLKLFFITDPIYPKKMFPLIMIIISTAFGLYIFTYFLLFGVPKVEGLMEELSSLLFLFSGLVLIAAIGHVKQDQFTTIARKEIIVTLLLSAAALIFIFGEEISWGQRIFNWKAEGVFEEYNFQKETNTHNFFNPLFKFVYPVVGIGSFIFLFFVWFFPRENIYFFMLFIPPPSLFFIVFFLACASFLHTEIYEQLLAIFILLHSTRIFVCLKNRDTKTM